MIKLRKLACEQDTKFSLIFHSKCLKTQSNITLFVLKDHYLSTIFYILTIFNSWGGVFYLFSFTFVAN